MGILGRLILSLSGVLILLTLIIGAAFALREQGELIELKRDHLKHSAAIVSRLLDQAHEGDGTSELVEGLSSVGEPGPYFRVVWSGDHSGLARGSSESLSGATEVLSVSRPLPPNGRLIVAEELPDTRASLASILFDHLLIGALLTAAAVLAVALVCQRVVVRPIRALVDAADAVANGKYGEPLEPGIRSRDEIGVLADHLAEMSRRLVDAMRGARYAAAHLVALRVLRETEEPLHRLALSLATLEAVTTGTPDVEKEVQEMSRHIATLRGVARRFAEVPAEP